MIDALLGARWNRASDAKIPRRRSSALSAGEWSMMFHVSRGSGFHWVNPSPCLPASKILYWGVHKWGIMGVSPVIIHFNAMVYYKPSFWGYPFMETPISSAIFRSFCWNCRLSNGPCDPACRLLLAAHYSPDQDSSELNPLKQVNLLRGRGTFRWCECKTL